MMSPSEQKKLIESMISEAEAALLNGSCYAARVRLGSLSNSVAAIIVRLYKLHALRQAINERATPQGLFCTRRTRLVVGITTKRRSLRGAAVLRRVTLGTWSEAVTSMRLGVPWSGPPLVFDFVHYAVNFRR